MIAWKVIDMEVKIKVEGLNPQQTMKRILNQRAQKFTAVTIARYMDQFVPYLHGDLSKNYIIKDSATSDGCEIEYQMAYAHRQYNGNDHTHYTKETHLNATHHWDRPVSANYKPAIASEVTAYIKRG